MEIDFSAVDDPADFVSIPEGVYHCRVAEVREGWTRDGDARWGMRLEVVEGPYAGRTAAWDGVSWGERGLRRAKFVLAKLGFDTGGRLSVESGELVGRTAWVEVRAEERFDPGTGVRSLRLRVPFLGYAEDPTELVSG
ncbi:MAG: hypothetical protein R3F34_10475 [Planctomycetota bacterium]